AGPWYRIAAGDPDRAGEVRQDHRRQAPGRSARRAPGPPVVGLPAVLGGAGDRGPVRGAVRRAARWGEGVRLGLPGPQAGRDGFIVRTPRPPSTAARLARTGRRGF